MTVNPHIHPRDDFGFCYCSGVQGDERRYRMGGSMTTKTGGSRDDSTHAFSLFLSAMVL